MAPSRLVEALRTRPDGGGEDAGEFKMNPRRIAFHEAAHGVVDVQLGIRFDWVVALEDDGWMNAANPLVGWQRGDGARATLARRWAASMFAGAAGEEELGEGVAPWYSDFDSAEYWLRDVAAPRGASYVGDASFERQTRALRHRARQLVRAHWLAITNVANALLRLKALREREVERIVHGGVPPRS